MKKVKGKEKEEKVKLKKKESEILVLIYRFRFLNRVQIQRMLNHKHHGQIQAWLNSLVEKELVFRYYEKKFGGRPATYYLAPASRKYLKGQKGIKLDLLDRRIWREKDRTEEFKEHCLFMADAYLDLKKFTKEGGTTLYYYSKTDLYGRGFIIEPKPDAYFAIDTNDGSTKRYFLDLFDEIPPRAMRARIDQYLMYYDEDTWYEEYPEKPFPTMIFVCPHKRIKGHLYHYIQDQLEYYPELEFFLITKERAKREGLNKETLEKVLAEE